MAEYDPNKTKPALTRRTGSEEPDATRPAGYDYDDDEDEGGRTRPQIPGITSERVQGGAKQAVGRIVVDRGERGRGVRITFPPNPMDQPVCGVLLVVTGPGKGVCLPVSYGRNSIGRDASARVRLDLGDDQVSGIHFILSYDASDGSFDLREADEATNFTYVNGARARSTVVLQTGDVIKAGATELRFIACCGPQWDWTREAKESA
jgi:hypothetical protein